MTFGTLCFCPAWPLQTPRGLQKGPCVVTGYYSSSHPLQVMLLAFKSK